MSKNVAINIRLDADVVNRVDEAAKLMGMKRARYCAYVLELSHKEEFNPMTVAEGLLRKAAE